MAITMYPPYIEGKLPAQYGDKLNIPFQLNRATGANEIQEQQMFLRLKHVSTNTVIDILPYRDATTNLALQNSFSITFNESGNHIASFSIPTKLKQQLKVGQYYKAQLGIGDNPIYSSVGVFKYTVKPQVFIQNLEGNIVNNSLNSYTGSYSSKLVEIDADGNEKVLEQDSSEKVYEYCFDLYNGDILIETSGKILHNSTADTSPNDSTDTFYFKTELLDNVYYQVVYTVYTNNGLIISSPLYYIRKTKAYLSHYNFELLAESDYDEGSVKVFIKKEFNNSALAGRFKLCRASSLEEYKFWGEIAQFVLDTNLTQEAIKIYEDYTVQQGVQYKYAISQIDVESGLSTSFNISNIITADFEDAFLYDGERQLKLRFNPKIASFKNTLLEQKMDTIGGRYPFVFRNGNTNYKEFSISAMISMLMDENSKFMPQNYKEDFRTSTKTRKNPESLIQAIRTNLVSQNITKERDFKIEVLEWLTNGRNKLFRSPTEGNYIVRLLNTSLSPNDTLGRMLHTFTSTAYEVDDNDFDSLKRNNLFSGLSDQIDTMRYIHLDLKDYQEYTVYETHGALVARIFDATPGSKYDFTLQDNSNLSIIIGYTGAYNFPVDKNNLVKSIGFNPVNAGKIELGFIGQEKYPIVDQLPIIETEGQEPVNKTLTLKNIAYFEKCEQFKSENNEPLNVLEKITRKNEKITETEYSFNSLDNVIYLKIEATELSTEVNKYCEIELNNSYLLFDLNGTDTFQSFWNEKSLSRQQTYGLIELKASVEYPEIKPTVLIISPGVTVDIYYSGLAYTYEN